MKKYICGNCGFRSRFQVKDIKRDDGTIHHRCCNCDAVVFPTKLVLQSMMRGYMIDKKLNFPLLGNEAISQRIKELFH